MVGTNLEKMEIKKSFFFFFYFYPYDQGTVSGLEIHKSAASVTRTELSPSLQPFVNSNQFSFRIYFLLIWPNSCEMCWPTLFANRLLLFQNPG